MRSWSLPVKGPLQQELAGRFRETRSVLVGLEDLTDHVVEPGGPLLQGALLLQRSFKVLLETLHHALLALADPWCLLLHNTHTSVPLTLQLCLAINNKHVWIKNCNGESVWCSSLKGCELRCTCTLAKSTRFRSLSIWLICEVFCRTARAAWARWFRDVYLRKVCAKALTADTWGTENRVLVLHSVG